MYARDIAGFVSGLRYGAIRAEVRERIKLLILDALGIAGTQADAVLGLEKLHDAGRIADLMAKG